LARFTNRKEMIHMRIPSAALAAALISICAFASTSQAVPANPSASC